MHIAIFRILNVCAQKNRDYVYIYIMIWLLQWLNSGGNIAI